MELRSGSDGSPPNRALKFDTSETERDSRAVREVPQLQASDLKALFAPLLKAF